MEKQKEEEEIEYEKEDEGEEEKRKGESPPFPEVCRPNEVCWRGIAGGRDGDGGNKEEGKFKEMVEG